MSRPGFRFSQTDAIAIVVGAVVTGIAWRFLPSAAPLFLVVLAHFFLFCNVFRVRRSSELVWGAVFLVNVVGWLALSEFHWLGVLALQAPVTIVVIALEIRSSGYHGVLWRRINPRSSVVEGELR